MARDYEGFLYAANNDVRAIEGLYSLGVDGYCEVIAFHAQQAAEKMVKNVYTINGEFAPKTHAVDELWMYAIDQGWIDESASSFQEAAANLTQYAVMARYTQVPDIGRGEALQAIADCNSIAKALIDEGYDAIRIEVEANYLHEQ